MWRFSMARSTDRHLSGLKLCTGTTSASSGNAHLGAFGEVCGAGALEGGYVISREIPRQHWRHSRACFRAYRRTNACLYEGSALLVFSGYCRGGSEAEQDLVIQAWTKTMSQTSESYRLTRP